MLQNNDRLLVGFSIPYFKISDVCRRRSCSEMWWVTYFVWEYFNDKINERNLRCNLLVPEQIQNCSFKGRVFAVLKVLDLSIKTDFLSHVSFKLAAVLLIVCWCYGSNTEPLTTWCKSFQGTQIAVLLWIYSQNFYYPIFFRELIILLLISCAVSNRANKK